MHFFFFCLCTVGQKHTFFLYRYAPFEVFRYAPNSETGTHTHTHTHTHIHEIKTAERHLLTKEDSAEKRKNKTL